jgi:hypothetical protein
VLITIILLGRIEPMFYRSLVSMSKVNVRKRKEWEISWVQGKGLEPGIV